MLIPCPQCKALIALPDADPGPDQPVDCANCGHRFKPPSNTVRQEAAVDRLSQASGTPLAAIRIGPADVPPYVAPPSGRVRVRTRNPVATLFWGLTSLLLILTLCAQYAYVTRDEFARHVQLRPWLEWLCLHAGCTLPLMRSPELIRIAGRDIRRHPDIADALIVNITITNQATYFQAWPNIQLGFFDLRNRPLALRRFSAEEYLPPELSIENGMPMDTPIRIRLDIVDPGPEAVNFSFELL